MFPELCASLVLIEGLGPLSFEESDFMTRFRRYVRKRYHKPSLGLKAFNSIEEAAALRSRDSDLSEDLAKLVVTRGLKKVESGLQWSSDPRLLYQTLRPHTEENIEAFFEKFRHRSYSLFQEKSKSWRNI